MFTDPISSQSTTKAEIASLLAMHGELSKTDQDASDQDAYAKALSIVAHDLKGPLANLALLVEDIFHCAENNRVQRIPHKAEKADQIIGKMSEMLSAVLERARDGRDPLSATKAPIDLTDIIELVFTVNQPTARLKSIALLAEPTAPVLIDGDAELLFEAFDNLIGNAIRHSQEGGTISFDATAMANGNIQAQIIDDGPGFSATDLLRAFRPFANLYSASNGKHGAAGSVDTTKAQIQSGSIDIALCRSRRHRPSALESKRNDDGEFAPPTKQNNDSGLSEAPGCAEASSDARFLFVKVAERKGFEPSIRF